MPGSGLKSAVTLEHGAVARAVEFTVDSQIVRGTMFMPADALPRFKLVFAHGLAGIRGGPHDIFNFLGRVVAANGAAALLFDFRGRGESEGNGLEVSLQTMAADLLAAVNFARTQAGDGSEKIFVCGMCSGGNVAIGALPMLGKVAGLFLLSVYPFSEGDTFTRDLNRSWYYLRLYWRKLWQVQTWRRFFSGAVSLKRVLRVIFRAGQKGQGLKNDAAAVADADGTVAATTKNKEAPVKHLENLNCRVPALMIYGGADPDTPAARRYFEVHTNKNSLPVNFLEIPGANHNFSSIAWKRQLAESALQFFNRLV